MANNMKCRDRCKRISIETVANIYGIVLTCSSAVELLCYTVLCSALHHILENQKQKDYSVCDMSLKTFDDSDECEVKGSKVAAALLSTSCFQVLMSFLALRGAYKTNVYLCYIWLVFTSLVVILFPLLQSMFFMVTTWWNAASFTVMILSSLHSVVKLSGMYIMVRFVGCVRTRQQGGNNTAAETADPTAPNANAGLTSDKKVGEKDSVAHLTTSPSTLPDDNKIPESDTSTDSKNV